MAPSSSTSYTNTHVTFDLHHFINASEYVGDDQIVVGSGQSLPITHTGCGTHPISTSSLKLFNLLRVPTITSNPLSVNRLCTDNHCIFIFDSDSFTIQDKTTGQILFQGPSVNGLYPLHSAAFRTSPSSSQPTVVAHVGTRTSSCNLA